MIRNCEKKIKNNRMAFLSLERRVKVDAITIVKTDYRV